MILSFLSRSRLETIDGSATAGEDYIPVKQTLVFKPEQTYIEYVVEIIDDNVYEPDETFFVKMALEPEQDAIMGKKSINMITIINDDGRFHDPNTKHIKFEKNVRLKYHILLA